MTAQELFDKMLQENDECTSTEMMIEFAKYHVEKALKQASKKVNRKEGLITDYKLTESILNAYPTNLIK